MTPEDFVWLVGLLQAEGLSPATTSKVLSVASRVFRFSARRPGFAGSNPVSLLMLNERPTVAATTRFSVGAFVHADRLFATQSLKSINWWMPLGRLV